MLDSIMIGSVEHQLFACVASVFVCDVSEPGGLISSSYEVFQHFSSGSHMLYPAGCLAE